MGRARQLADISGGVSGAILMDASAADTDVNDNLLLNATDSDSTDAGFNLLYENGTHDAAVTLPVGRDNLSLTGSIVQVKQGQFTSFVTLTNSGTSAVFADIFCSVNITPTSASNKILLQASLSISSGTADRLAFVKFVGGNTADFLSGRAIGSRTPCHQAIYFAGSNEMLSVSMNQLDSPATTDSIEYKIQVAPNFTSGNLFVNKINFDSDNAYIPSAASIITAMEVEG
tara:strand:+ start:185 stop:874 length:690 start_codon:yes stop_codon:yes gene_type:complete